MGFSFDTDVKRQGLDEAEQRSQRRGAGDSAFERDAWTCGGHCGRASGPRTPGFGMQLLLGALRRRLGRSLRRITDRG